MGLWKRALVYLALVDEDELEEEFDEEASLDEASPPEPPTIRTIPREEASHVQAVSSPPLGQVHFVEPRVYDDAKEVGDKIREAVPVIMNLQGVDDDLFRKLTAFASGLAYGLDGNIQPLAHRVYLITPANVEVSAEDRRRLAERGVFDEL